MNFSGIKAMCKFSYKQKVVTIISNKIFKTF